LVAPHFQSLDAREVVQEAVKLGQPLQLKVETILHGVRRLEVSYLEGKVNREKKWRVGGVTVLHRKGQSLVIFQEPRFAEWPNFQTGADVAEFKARLNRTHPGLTFRIWRSSEKINPATIARARLVGECSLFSAWNDGYHQDETRRQAPVRFRILDKGEPVPWGTGIYAHNPDKAGSAYYAVTVAVHGEEDLDSLGAGNIFQDPV
jgi:hypothetical protein